MLTALLLLFPHLVHFRFWRHSFHELALPSFFVLSNFYRDLFVEVRANFDDLGIGTRTVDSADHLKRFAMSSAFEVGI